MEKLYEIRYENGASHTIYHAESLVHAMEISKKSILDCLPKDFDPVNLVQPIIAREVKCCVFCGDKGFLYTVENNTTNFICDNCVRNIEPIYESLNLKKDVTKRVFQKLQETPTHELAKKIEESKLDPLTLLYLEAENS